MKNILSENLYDLVFIHTEIITGGERVEDKTIILSLHFTHITITKIDDNWKPFTFNQFLNLTNLTVIRSLAIGVFILSIIQL